MVKVPREIIRELIKSEEFKSTGDIMTAIKAMFADVLQEVLEAELDTALGYEKHQIRHEGSTSPEERNYRNGTVARTIKTELGEIPVKVPRDRKGEFEPQIISKYQRNADGMEEKIIGLYAAGMTQSEVAEQIKALYDVEISPELVSRITDKILPQVNEWQNRPLEAVYPFVFLDAIHYKVRDNGKIVTKAAYVVLGVTLEGYKPANKKSIVNQDKSKSITG